MNHPFKQFSSALLLLLALSGGSLVISGCASSDNRSSTGEYIDDSVITTKVKTAIFNDDSLEVLDINVETRKGVVQLSGFVNSQQDINRAIAVARDVEGVKSVENSMSVK